VVIPKKYNYNHEELFILEQLKRRLINFLFSVSLLSLDIIIGDLRFDSEYDIECENDISIAVYRLHIITSIAISFHELHVQRLYLKPT